MMTDSVGFTCYYSESIWIVKLEKTLTMMILEEMDINRDMRWTARKPTTEVKPSCQQTSKRTEDFLIEDNNKDGQNIFMVFTCERHWQHDNGRTTVKGQPLPRLWDPLSTYECLWDSRWIQEHSKKPSTQRSESTSILLCGRFLCRISSRGSQSSKLFVR